jgi:restriction system protein
MARRREESNGTTYCLIWIVLFTVLAGFFWPRTLGIIFMGLSLIGLLHLAVLVYEKIAEAKFHEDMTPEEFEHYCAAVLQEMKWKARVTQVSGDQGVDIVADMLERNRAKTVIQSPRDARQAGSDVPLRLLRNR